MGVIDLASSARRHGGVVRMGAVYAAACAGTGVSLPFIAPWFAAHGLKGAEIATVLAVPLLARLVTAPLIAVWADSFRLRRTPIALLALTAALAYAAVGISRSFAAWLPIWFVASTAMYSIPPLADVLTLRSGRREGFQYGTPRGVGSLSFVLANAAMGELMANTSVDAVIVWIVAAAALAAAVAFFIAPPEPVLEGGARSSQPDRFKGLGRLVADPTFMTAIVSVGLIQAAHAFYYAFSTLAWKAQGISEPVWGLLWATGVIAEVGFLWFFEPVRRRLGPWRMLMLSGAGSIVRWTAFAFLPPLWLLWPLQLLHALTFAASFVAGLQIVERICPPESTSAAQTLSSALSAGVLIGLATVFSGPLFDRYGALGYLAMSVLAALGLLGGLRLKAALSGLR
jgi:PPP family 3-phenylpropionic acid transporter